MAKTPETPDAVQVTTVSKKVPAQVSQPREPDADKVQVHEVSVTLDKVITDPSDPLAVQVPDEVAQLTLPIHSLEAPSAEQVFDGAKPVEGQGGEPVEDREEDTPQA